MQDNDGWPDVSGGAFTDDTVVWVKNKGGLGLQSDDLFDGTTIIPLVFPDGPCMGAFSSTFFDWNNDGWLDISSACRYATTLRC
jgi:hypothetical protein